MAETQYPSQFDELLQFNFDQPSKKREKSYGLKLIKALWGTFNSAGNGQTSGYYTSRNDQWKENDDFAKGKINTATLLQSLGIEQDKSFVSYDLKALLRIVPRYLQAILGGFMNREEKVSVAATDILSRSEKDKSKQGAIYRLKNQEQIAALQQASGQELEQGEKNFEDMDEVDMYYDLEFKLPQEMFFETTTQEVLQNSEYDNLKRQTLSDLTKKNFAATKIIRYPSRDRSLANRIKIRRCKPDRCVYNVFESPIGEDVSLFGEVYPMSISDIRRNYPNTSEETLYEIARKAATNQNLLNFVSWQPNFTEDTSRPYDEYKIPVFDFEVKVADKNFYVKTTNQYGGDVIVKKNGRPNPQNGEIVEESKFNIYCGTWVLDSDFMLGWEVAPNQIRAYQNGVDCFFSYSVVIPDNDGTISPSLLERGTACVREMVRCALKIQQMMITMKPDDVSVDVAGLRDLDLGTGNTLQPMQITKIYDQTGRIYWDSTDVTGTNAEGNRIPFAQIPNSGNAAQINTLIGLYNFWLARLNDEWGTNPDALGQPLPARRSNGVNQNQIQAANQATEYIYEAHVELRKQETRKIAMILWDSILFNADDFKDLNGDQSMMARKFDVNFDMVPVEQDRQWLEQMIQVAIERQSITPGQAIRIRNMDNVKKAELYLIRLERKQQQQAADAQQQNVQMNAQVQQQSLQMKAQADSAVKQAGAEAEAQLGKSRTDDAAWLELVKLATTLQIDAHANGRPINDQNMQLINFVTSKILGQQQMQDAQAAQAAQQQPEQQESPQGEQQEPQQEAPQQEQQEQQPITQ